ncbi:superkiller complex protein 2-like [Physella acuta]|uniref:superkiller complex protein 2-like n=1 Tax=Physella acuta TaxID=109671 RepID=UPI0027DD8870|nr:superkiller complex protein 2-like [Physella acuta]
MGFREDSSDISKFISDLAAFLSLENILRVAETVGECQKNAGMLMPVEVFKEQLHFGLVEVVYRWAQGEYLSKLAEDSQLDEGVIVRAIQALVELLGRVQSAADGLGIESLPEKCQKAVFRINRGIILLPSLYLEPGGDREESSSEEGGSDEEDDDSDDDVVIEDDDNGDEDEEEEKVIISARNLKI